MVMSVFLPAQALDAFMRNYAGIEMFNNQVKYKLKEAQHKIETDGLSKEQLKAKFDRQIQNAKADLKKHDDYRRRHDKK